MNQDSFRRLLDSSRPLTSSSALGAASTSRSRLVVQSRQKNAVEVVSKPAFKPRNIRKTEDAKAKVAQDVPDVSVEPPPSRGLDFALLEEERAKAELLSTNDVDELEQAFAESSAAHNSEQVAPKKRTREELVRELKEKRLADAGQPSDSVKADVQLEEAKHKGKFKPIGFASISKRKKDDPSKADRKKKKRKVENDKNDFKAEQATPVVTSIIDTPPTRETPQEPVPTADEDFDDNFDIFAGAGEYVGIEIDENEDDAETTSHRAPPHAPEVPSSLPQRWIAMDEPEHAPQSKPQIPLPVPKPEVATVAPDQEVEEQPIRLAPLESSSVPSIKQLLDMHDAADKYEKKLKRKEKKQRKRGGKGKGSDED